MVPVAGLLGLAAYSSARTPLKDLVPWLPVGLSLLLILTTYTLPHFWPTFNDSGPVDHHILLEEGLTSFADGSDVGSTDSIPRFQDFDNQDGSPRGIPCREHSTQDHHVSHMSRPASRSCTLSSVHDSEHILRGLPDTALKRWLNTSRAREYMDANRVFPDPTFHCSGLPVGSGHPCCHCHGQNWQSSSPGTQAADCPSKSTESTSPLPEQDRERDLMDP